MKRLQLFPVTTKIETSSGAPQLSIAGCDLVQLAEEYGTPLYLYDQATMDASFAAYHAALADTYPGPSGVTYAGKAFLCSAMARYAGMKGLWLDCTGAGDLHIAGQAGVRREQVLVHGVNKSPSDLDAAMRLAGVIVVDNLAELKRLVLRFKTARSQPPELWLRLRPGIAVDTHAHTQTGQEDSKFGLDPAEFLQALEIGAHHRLPITGLHFHQGSHFHDTAPLPPAVATALDLAGSARQQLGWTPQVICPGGGWGVAYHEDELPHPSIPEYVGCLARHIREGCEQRGLPLPRLQLEPGRSLVALAGVAMYRVGAVKHTPGRRYLLLDGGLADNPRPALYGARYSALPVREPEREFSGPAWLAGPFCESGDILIHDLPMPDIQPGELVCVPVSGAYQLAMGSNYNGARKPAVAWLENGRAHLAQRRETLDDLVRRDEWLPEA
jgi:diaminopimelate decarboxylase